MTKEQREALRNALASVRADRDALAYGIKYVTDEIAAKDDLLETIAQASAGVSVEEIGECESCNAVLLPGDKVCTTSEDGELCEECAPTWGDLISMENKRSEESLFEEYGTDWKSAHANYIVALYRNHPEDKAVHPKS